MLNALNIINGEKLVFQLALTNNELIYLNELEITELHFEHIIELSVGIQYGFF